MVYRCKIDLQMFVKIEGKNEIQHGRSHILTTNLVTWQFSKLIYSRITILENLRNEANAMH